MKNCSKKLIALALATTMFTSSLLTQASAVTTDEQEISLDPVVTQTDMGNKIATTRLWGFENDENVLFDIPDGRNDNGIASITNDPKFIFEGDGALNLTRSTSGDFLDRYRQKALIKETYNSAKISVWMYVGDWENNGEYNSNVMILKGSDTTSPLYETEIGVKYLSAKKSAVLHYRIKSSSKETLSGTFNSSIMPKAGWYKFTADYTQSGKLTVSVENENLEKIDSVTANGVLGVGGDVKEIYIQDIWSTYKPTASKIHPVASNSYIDNLEITTYELDSSNPNTASNPLSYDVLDMFGWTPATEFSQDASAYEYTINGTDENPTYTSCTTNPQAIPAGEYAIGDVGVRLKAEFSDSKDNPALFNEKAYTNNENDGIYDFENSNQIDNFGVTFGKASLSTVYSHSGNNSLTFTHTNNPTSQPRVHQYFPFEDVLKEKYVTMWFYDDLNSNTAVRYSLYDATDMPSKPTNSSNQKVIFDIRSNKYQFAYEKNSSVTSNIARTKGWHSITWDYTSGTGCTLSLDGIELDTFKGALGFNYFSIQDAWYSTSAEIKPYIIDDFIISSTASDTEKLIIQQAPANFKGDDINNTFSFTPIVGYNEPTMYEYSLDYGKTWSICNSFTQELQDIDLEISQLAVRLKSIKGMLPGMTLKNDSTYTSQSSINFNELKDMYDFAKALFLPNYKAENINSFETALKDTETLISSLDNDLDAQVENEDEINTTKQALSLAIDNLGSPELKPNTVYQFETGDKGVNPFVANVGEVVFGEQVTSWGDPENDYSEEYYLDRIGVRLETEKIDDLYSGEASYTFTEDVKNKKVGLAVAFSDDLSGTIQYSLHSENGDYIGIKALPVTESTYYRVVTKSGNVVKDEMLPIRGAGSNGMHFFYWDMTKGETILYMDNRAIATIPMSGFNEIKASMTDATNPADIAIFDRLTILEENPAISVSIPEDIQQKAKEGIGYFETLDMPLALLDVKTLHEGYDTTDKITYTSSDENIFNVTTGGSVEPMNFGEATITLNLSGLSQSIDVKSVDFKIKDLFITDSPLNDVVAMGAPGQSPEENKSIPVIDTECVSMDIDESVVLNAVITPKNATARLANWKSDDTNIAIVKDGLVTGVGYGTTTITATSQDGTNISDSIQVNIIPDDFEAGLEVFVSTKGDDYNGNGSIENPFATFERARDEVRTISGILPNKGAIIYFREGSYTITSTIELNDNDSGTTDKPIRYVAYNEEDVTFVGGINFKASMLEKVEADDVNASKIHDDAKGKLYKINLAEKFNMQRRQVPILGATASFKKYGNAFEEFNTSVPYYSIIADGEPMILARYPNGEEQIKTSSIVYTGENTRHWETDAITSGWGYPYEPGMEDEKFVFTSNSLSASKLASWSQSIGMGENNEMDGVWMMGYWGVPYSNHSIPVASIDGNKIHSGLVSNYEARSNGLFYVFNLLEELDVAGEWYVDQLSNPNEPTLYIYPPKGFSETDSEITIPVLEEEMIHMYETDNITFNGINFSSSSSGFAIVEGGTHNVFRKSEMDNNIGKLIDFKDSKNGEMPKFSGVEMCTMNNTDGGISLGGGDVYTLERGYNYVENCSFTTFSCVTAAYNPAVSLGGVGNRVSNTTLKDSPHNTLSCSAPESLVEFMHIEDVIKEAGDQGAVYTGRDQVNRGVIIRNCVFKNIGSASHVNNAGIYLDDARSGVTIIDNYFEGSEYGAKISGGRDNIVIGNTFNDVTFGIVITPFVYMWTKHVHSTAIGLYSEANNQEAVTTVPWYDPTSAYGRFEHLYYTLSDEFPFGKYCKIIDNTFLKINGKNDANEENPNYYLWSRKWNYSTYDDQKALIYDWWFVKGNTPNQVNTDTVENDLLWAWNK